MDCFLLHPWKSFVYLCLRIRPPLALLAALFRSTPRTFRSRHPRLPAWRCSTTPHQTHHLPPSKIKPATVIVYNSISSPTSLPPSTQSSPCENKEKPFHFGRPYRKSVSRASAGAVRCKASPLFISSPHSHSQALESSNSRLGVIGTYLPSSAAAFYTHDTITADNFYSIYCDSILRLSSHCGCSQLKFIILKVFYFFR